MILIYILVITIEFEIFSNISYPFHCLIFFAAPFPLFYISIYFFIFNNNKFNIFHEREFPIDTQVKSIIIIILVILANFMICDGNCCNFNNIDMKMLAFLLRKLANYSSLEVKQF